MNHFFVSGYLDLKPFNMAVSTWNCYPKESEITDLLVKHTGHPAQVVVLNIIPMTEEEFNTWTS